jgi:hypothetical protein
MSNWNYNFTFQLEEQVTDELNRYSEILDYHNVDGATQQAQIQAEAEMQGRE